MNHTFYQVSQKRKKKYEHKSICWDNLSYASCEMKLTTSHTTFIDSYRFHIMVRMTTVVITTNPETTTATIQTGNCFSSDRSLVS